MFGIFKVIGYLLNIKKGIEKPDELLFETAAGLVGVYFTISFIILGVLTLVSGIFGFSKDIMALKILMVAFIISIIITLLIFMWLRKMIRRASEKIDSYAQPYTKKVQEKLVSRSNKTTI